MNNPCVNVPSLMIFSKKLDVQNQNWNPITTNKFSNGEDQLDRSCEKRRIITMNQGGKE
jgi:hypothetical protein